MARSFTVLGLQRSGTNFTEQCLKNNFKHIHIENTAGPGRLWKHAYDCDRTIVMNKNKCFILIYKHPYSWVESVMKSNVDLPKRYPEVCANAKTDAVYRADQIDLLKLVQLWNKYNLYWTTIIKERPDIMQIRYEDFIASHAASVKTVRRIAQHFNMELVNNDVINIPKKVSQSDPWTEDSRKKYTEMLLSRLGWVQVKMINNVIDKNIVKQYGYDLIDNELDYLRHYIKK